MTDDIMTRVREWLASCVRVATENGVPEEADLEAAALAFIDGEPARLADELRRARRARGGQVKTPKRVKGWVEVVPGGRLPRLCRTRKTASAGVLGAVRVVELRRGEVIVDVEALVAEARGQWKRTADDITDLKVVDEILRAALRKVGKR